MAIIPTFRAKKDCFGRVFFRFGTMWNRNCFKCSKKPAPNR